MSNSPQQQNALQTTETFSSDEFSALLNKEFRPKTDQAKEAVENAVKTLAQQALEIPSPFLPTPTAPSRR